MGIEPTSIGLRDRCVTLTPTSRWLESSRVASRHDLGVGGRTRTSTARRRAGYSRLSSPVLGTHVGLACGAPPRWTPPWRPRGSRNTAGEPSDRSGSGFRPCDRLGDDETAAGPPRRRDGFRTVRPSRGRCSGALRDVLAALLVAGVDRCCLAYRLAREPTGLAGHPDSRFSEVDAGC